MPAGTGADSVLRVSHALQVSTQVLQAMLGNDKLSASVLVAEIQDTRQLLEGEGDTTSSRFLKVLQVPGASAVLASDSAANFSIQKQARCCTDCLPCGPGRAC